MKIRRNEEITLFKNQSSSASKTDEYGCNKINEKDLKIIQQYIKD